MPNPFQFSRHAVPAAVRFAGHAIVSADGMIADAAGAMPAGLRNDADWRRFQAALDASVLVVLGRLGHELYPGQGRRRLVFTSAVPALEPAAAASLAWFYNPAGLPLDAALRQLGIDRGTIAVPGGTRVFEAFLPLYDGFALAEVHGLVLPGGRPCFSAGHPRSTLAAAGLVPISFELIDPAAGVTLTHWQRPA